MKLKKIYIEEYKNLKDFTIDFEAGNGLSILIGNNGSGKSNVIEVISGIFHDLFMDKDGRKIPCDYTLEYVLNEVSCKIEQQNGVLRCYGPKFKSRDDFISHDAPNNIIGLYSGEEDRLWTTFYEPYYKAYIRRIKTNRYQERMRLMLVNKYYWNVALLTLLLSRNETLEPFIKEELGIDMVSEVELKFNFQHYNEDNGLLKAFIDSINPDHCPTMQYSLQELRDSIYLVRLMFGSEEVTIVDKNGDSLLVESGITDAEVFQYLTQAYMPKKDKVISSISISFNNGITLAQLSEGEKKLILVKTVLEILSDEKTLILMDEPDAHLHEDRKAVLLELMRDYPNRQTVVTTHSPVIAQTAKDTELVMLECENGRTTVIDDEKIEKIKRLSGSSWDVIGQGMMLKSNRPLIVFEGKTDVMYVKRALELLKPSHPKYSALKVDFLNANGAGNVKSFVDYLMELVPENKRIIIFFDRDDAGKNGAQTVTGISKHDERIVKYQDLPQENVMVSFIPYKDGINSGDFLIEDYFSWNRTIDAIMKDLIPAQWHPIKSLPNLPDRIKKEIEKRYTQFNPEEFVGFIPLLDKIMELSQEMPNEQ